MAEIRTLTSAHTQSVEHFLRLHVATSMILLANATAHGIVYAGRPQEGTYVGAFEDDALVGVAAHYWNGMLFLQAPQHARELARAAVAASGRALSGAGGPYAQVQEAMSALGMLNRLRINKREVLFDLDLANLKVPPALASRDVHCRPSREGDLELLATWREASDIELFASSPGPSLTRQSLEGIRRSHEACQLWVLEHENVLVAMSGFTARVPGVVQVGGVYTPPALRNAGYARAAVAGSLLDARRAGAARAILFTGEQQLAAQKAYFALGFNAAGDYGLAFVSE